MEIKGAELEHLRHTLEEARLELEELCRTHGWLVCDALEMIESSLEILNSNDNRCGAP